VGKAHTATRTRSSRKKRRPKARPRHGAAASSSAAIPVSVVTAASGVTWHEPRPAPAGCPYAVRATTPADAAAVAALWKELSRLHIPLGEEWAVAEGAAERYARGVAAAAGHPRSLFLVAEMERDGAWRVVGFLHAAVKLRSPVYRESVVGEIPAICVLPGASGRGVGTALVDAAMDWFARRGIAQVEATVAYGRPEGRAFFRASGFRDSSVTLWAQVPPRVRSVNSPADSGSLLCAEAPDGLAKSADPLGEA